MPDNSEDPLVTCRRCGYEGPVSKWKTCLSVYHDIRCPECVSTNCEHNDRYYRRLQEGMKKIDGADPGPYTGAVLIAAERLRQIHEEGYGDAHDDEHDHSRGELAWAAVCYAAPDRVRRVFVFGDSEMFKDPWPFKASGCGSGSGGDKRAWMGRDQIPNQELSPELRIDLLVKAGALIAAEIDRLHRKGGRP